MRWEEMLKTEPPPKNRDPPSLRSERETIPSQIGRGITKTDPNGSAAATI